VGQIFEHTTWFKNPSAKADGCHKRISFLAPTLSVDDVSPSHSAGSYSLIGRNSSNTKPSDTFIYISLLVKVMEILRDHDYTWMMGGELPHKPN
jgi:hypothetical protein